MSPVDDHIAALHESAHACYAAMKGWDVKEIVLHKIGARQDEQGHVALHNPSTERDGNPLAYVTYLLIAGAAERRSCGVVTGRCSHDYEIARHLCSVNLDKDLDSAAVVQTIASIEAVAYVTVLDERFWAWVQRTSRALVRKRRLTGRDLAELREARR